MLRFSIQTWVLYGSLRCTRGAVRRSTVLLQRWKHEKRPCVCLLWCYKCYTEDVCTQVGGKLKLELSVELLLSSRAVHRVLQQRRRPGRAAADLLLWSLGSEQLSGASSGSQRPAVYCPARCAGNGSVEKVYRWLCLLWANTGGVAPLLEIGGGWFTHRCKSGGKKSWLQAINRNELGNKDGLKWFLLWHSSGYAQWRCNTRHGWALHTLQWFIGVSSIRSSPAQPHF